MLANRDSAADPVAFRVKWPKSKSVKSNGANGDDDIVPEGEATIRTNAKSMSRSRKAQEDDEEGAVVALVKGVDSIAIDAAPPKKPSKSKNATAGENRQLKIAVVPSSTNHVRPQPPGPSHATSPAMPRTAAAGGNSNNGIKSKPPTPQTSIAEPIDHSRNLDSDTAAAIIAALPKTQPQEPRVISIRELIIKHAKKPPPPPPRNRRFKLRLLDLPNDILHMLYGRLSAADMIILAATCKDASRIVLPTLYYHARVCSIRSLRGLYFAVSNNPKVFAEAVRSIVVTRTFLDESQVDLDTGLSEGIKIVPESGIPSSRYITSFGTEFVRTLPMVWLAKIAELCPNIKGIDLSLASSDAFRPGLNLGFLDFANVLRERGAWFQPPESFPVSTVVVKQKNSRGVAVDGLFHVEFMDFGRKLMDVSNNVVSSRLVELNLYPFHELVPGGKREHATWKIRNVTLFDPVPFNPVFDIDMVRHGDLYETVGIEIDDAHRFELPLIKPDGASASWRGRRVTLWGDVVHNAFSTLTRFGLDKSVCRSLICRGDAFDSFDMRNPNAYPVLMRQTMAFMTSLRASPWRALNRLVLGPPMFLLESAKISVQFFRDAAVGMPNLVDLTLLTTHAPVHFVLAVVEPLLRRPRKPLRALSISREADYSADEEGEAGINAAANWPLPASPAAMTEGPRCEPRLARLSIHDAIGVEAFWANNATQMPFKLMELMHPSVITSLKSINLYGMPVAGTTLAHPITDASFVPFVQVPATAVPLFAISFANLRTLAIDSVAIEHAVTTDWAAVDYDETLSRVPPAPGVDLADLLPTCPVLECLIIDVWRFAYLPPAEQVMQYVKVLDKFPTLRMACFAVTRLSKEHLRQLYRRVYLPGPDGKAPFPHLMRLFVSNRDESEGAIQLTAAQVVAQANRPKKQAGKGRQVSAELPSDDDDNDGFYGGPALAAPLDWAESDDEIGTSLPSTKGKKGKGKPKPPSPPPPPAQTSDEPITLGKKKKRKKKTKEEEPLVDPAIEDERIELESLAAAAATAALERPGVPMPPPPSFTGLFAAGPGHARLRDVKFPMPVELTPAEMEEKFPVLDQELWQGDECMCGQRELGVHKTVWIDPLDGVTVCHRCCYWRQVRVTADPLRPVGPGFKKVIACSTPENYIHFINMKSWMEVDLES